jgi:hypothetical protein
LGSFLPGAFILTKPPWAGSDWSASLHPTRKTRTEGARPRCCPINLPGAFRCQRRRLDLKIVSEIPPTPGGGEHHPGSPIREAVCSHLKTIKWGREIKWWQKCPVYRGLRHLKAAGRIALVEVPQDEKIQADRKQHASGHRGGARSARLPTLSHGHCVT